MLLSIHVCRKMAVISLFSLVLMFQNTDLKAQGKTYGLLKKRAGNDENGYVLFSPLNCDTTYLINKCGQRVHHWVSPFTPGMSLYLQPNGHLIKTGTYTDTSFGVAGGRGGIIEEYDWNNQLIWRYKIFNDSLCQHHDIRPMPNGNVMVLAWHSISKQKAMALGRRSENFKINQSDLWGERLIELKPIGVDSAEIVWQWDLYDHIIQDADSALPNYGQINQHPELMNINYALTLQTNDWIHANGIDYNEDLDQVVISCHNISEFWIIDHSTSKAEAGTHSGGQFDKGGDILYRWGNPQAYNMGGSQDRKLFRQHHAYWIPKGYKDSGCIMLFNNGFNRDSAYSSVEVIQTPVLPNGSYGGGLPYGPTAPSWKYKDSIPTNFYSQIISGAERMPNGNTIICSGVQGLFFEVTPTGKTVWKYKNPLAGNVVKADGTQGNNPVFRCTFYPASYGAFSGKNLSGGRVLEKNSIPYSCLYESNAPVVTSLRPAKNSVDIAPDSVFQIVFNEPVLKSLGNISVFVNNSLYESIAMSSDLVSVSGNVLTIKHLKNLPFNSHVSIRVNAACVRDSSFNVSGLIDTAKWHFETRRAAPYVTGFYPDSGSINVTVNVHPYIMFDEAVHKTTGSIRLYENAVLKEKIAVSSQRIKVTGNIVTITPLGRFQWNSDISIAIDSGFADTFGYVCKSIDNSHWRFKTIAQPGAVSLNPAHKSISNKTSSKLTIKFDRPLSIDSIKPILIYENGSLVKQISLNDAGVVMNGVNLTIDPLYQFKASAHVSVSLPADALKDVSGNYFQGIDTASWQFVVENTSGVKTLENTQTMRFYPNPFAAQCYLESDLSIEQIELIDVLGKVHKVDFIKEEGRYLIRLDQLSEGAYMLRVNATHLIMISKS